jgi:adenylosuccinate lyase
MAAFGVLANLADDLRHLQRSEINEVAEGYAENSQVGSSAMPHKRNPITWENVKSLWKVFMPQIMTFYLDQVSEHQRDLSNSASARFLPRLLLGLAVAASRANRGLQSLTIDREMMEGRVSKLQEVVSGPLQALFSMHGVAEAHERVRLLTVRCRKEKRGLLELVNEDPELAGFLQQLTPSQRDALARPEGLVGPAEKATRRAVEIWSSRLGLERASK